MGSHVRALMSNYCQRVLFIYRAYLLFFVLCMLDELIQINILICIIVNYCE